MLKLNYQNLNYYNPLRNNFFSKSYILNDETYSNLGTIFLILNIQSNAQKGIKLSDVLQEIIRKEYFRQPIGKGTNQTDNFEKTINKINKVFSALANNENSEWIKKINISLISICNNKIQFTSTGNIKIFLIRNSSLLSLIQNNNKKINPSKLFLNIVSGTLQKEDKLIITTNELFKYFSDDNLKNIILKNSVKNICIKLQEQLSKENNAFPIASILLEVPLKEEVKTETTENYKKLLINNSSLNNNQDKDTLDENKSKSIDWTKIIKKYVINLLNRLKEIYKDVILNLNKKKSKNLSSENKTLNKINRNYSSSYRNINSGTKSILQTFLEKFKNLSRTSKILFVISVIFAFALIISLTFQINNDNTAENNGLTDQLLSEATEKEKLASDALIYKDFEKSKTLLFEVQEILNKEEILNTKSDKIKTEKENLLAKMKNQFDEIDKIIRTDDPVVIVEIPSKIKAEKLLGINENVYTYNSADNSIYQVEESKKNLGTIFENSNNISSFRLASSNTAKDSLIFITNDQQAVEFDLDKKELEKLDITYAKNDQEITDFSLYNDRLYLLDKTNNQIFKHTRTISGYSKGLTWIKEEEYNLNNAISFAIDGSVYILNQDGSILNFLNGYRRDFTLQQPSSPATSPTKIFTLTDYIYIYILDPQNNRVLVFDKQTSEFVNQYVSDKFTDMKDIYVDEINKKIFLLCGDKIYGIVLENIEE